MGRDRHPRPYGLQDASAAYGDEVDRDEPDSAEGLLPAAVDATGDGVGDDVDEDLLAGGPQPRWGLQHDGARGAQQGDVAFIPRNWALGCLGPPRAPERSSKRWLLPVPLAPVTTVNGWMPSQWNGGSDTCR
jgi:hypothetical protein